MFKQTSNTSAIAIAITVLIYPQIVYSETFKSKEVLSWPSDSQSFYFRTSVGMAGLIAARNSAEHSDCVDGWYFADTQDADAAILKVMRENPDYHPQAVILAMLQKACGSFSYGGG